MYKPNRKQPSITQGSQLQSVLASQENPFNSNKSQQQSQSQQQQQQGNGGMMENRLNLIESSLSRVCLQQDALMPLLSVVELLPQITKTEHCLKTIQKKMEDNENKYSLTEKNLEKKLKDVTNQGKNNKDGKFNKQLENVQGNVKDLENSFNNVYRWYEAKLKEETYIIQRSFDQKLEKQKQELQDQFQKQMAQKLGNSNSKSTNQYDQISASSHDIQQIYQYIDKKQEELKQSILQQFDQQSSVSSNNKFLAELTEIRSEFEQELRNVYKELGAIKCEVEFKQNYDRKIQIMEKIVSIPKDLDINEKKIKINILEQESFINDLQEYDKENTQRILYESRSIEKDCDIVMSNYQQYLEINDTKHLEQKIKELSFLLEKQVNLKYQVSGTKKKIVLELKKIEDKFEILSDIRRENPELISRSQYLKKDVANVDILEEKLQELMDYIHKNLEQCNLQLQSLGYKVIDSIKTLERLVPQTQQFMD